MLSCLLSGADNKAPRVQLRSVRGSQRFIGHTSGYSRNVNSQYKKRIAVAQKADRTAYDVRYSCRTEPPKMPRLGELLPRDHAAQGYPRHENVGGSDFSLCVVAKNASYTALVAKRYILQQKCLKK